MCVCVYVCILDIFQMSKTEGDQNREVTGWSGNLRDASRHLVRGGVGGWCHKLSPGLKELGDSIHNARLLPLFTVFPLPTLVLQSYHVLPLPIYRIQARAVVIEEL